MKNHIAALMMIILLLCTIGQVSSQITDNPKLFNEGGYVKGITVARVFGLTEFILGISGLVLSIRAKRTGRKKLVNIGLVLSLSAVLFSIIHICVTAGAVFGSGSGKAGSLFASIIVLIGIIVATQALRSQKPNSSAGTASR